MNRPIPALRLPLHKKPLPPDIERRLQGLGQALERCSGVVFAYVCGGASAGRLSPLSDVDVTVYLEETVDPVEGRLEAIGAVTRHLQTDEVDLVVLNTAPTSLIGRILQTRRVICDRDPVRRHHFESLALRSFFDFLRKLADLDQYVRQLSEYRDKDSADHRADPSTGDRPGPLP